MRLITAAVLASLVAVLAVPAASAAPAAGTSDRNVVQTAVAAGSFKTLVSLLKQAGLAKALQAKGPFTVFAPTDAAFAKVPRSTLAELAGDRAKLRSVLLYHVVPGKLTAAKVVQRERLRTLAGKTVGVRVAGGTVRVGGARVRAADVAASNGVIHVVDRVLVP